MWIFFNQSVKFPSNTVLKTDNYKNLSRIIYAVLHF